MRLLVFLWTDDTAASVVSMLFFLAAILLLAVAVGGIIVGSNQQASSPPDVEFRFDGDAERLTISRMQGDDFEADQVTVEGSATDFETEDESVTWADAPNGESGTVDLGDEIRLGSGVDRRYALQSGQLKLVWHDSSTGESVVIGVHGVESG